MIRRSAWLALLVACAGTKPDSAAPTDTEPPVETGDTASPLGPACVTPPTFGPATHALPTALPAPAWTATGEQGQLSSPRVADLNGDGVGDVVLGHGHEPGDDPLATIGHITAHDGATGAELWRADAAQEVFGTATFVELTSDGVPDVVIGGRNAELRALNGADGALLWALDADGSAMEAGWFNLYAVQALDDLDGDAVPDLLVASGGDVTAAPYAPRPEGRLAVLSGATGAAIATAPTPDRGETYMAPIATQLEVGGAVQVLAGTGGETWGGGLWRAPLAELLAGDVDAATPLWTGPAKGAMAPPSLVDLDGDCVPEVVLAAFDGGVWAISGATDAALWGHSFADAETYTSPAIGFFTDDDVPDVAVSASFGVWPLYTGATHAVLDGATGEVVWSLDAGVRAASTHAAVDLDGDGRDELLLLVDEVDDDGALVLVVRIVVPATGEVLSWEPLPQPAIAAPWVGDLDGDGTLDLLLATGDLAASPTWTLSRYILGIPSPVVTWGEYYGPGADMAL